MIRILFLLGDDVEDFDFFSVNALLHKCKDYYNIEIEYASHQCYAQSNNGFVIPTTSLSNLISKQYSATIIPGSKKYDSFLKYKNELAELLQRNILHGGRVYTICSGVKLLGELDLIQGFRISVHKEKGYEYVKYNTTIGSGVEKHKWLTSIGYHKNYNYVKSVECFFQVLKDFFPVSCIDRIIKRTEIRSMMSDKS
jgi:hypothetical protein